MVLGYFRWFWDISNGFGIFQMVLGYFRWFWDISNGFGIFQMVFESGFGKVLELFLRDFGVFGGF